MSDDAPALPPPPPPPPGIKLFAPYAPGAGSGVPSEAACHTYIGPIMVGDDAFISPLSSKFVAGFLCAMVDPQLSKQVFRDDKILEQRDVLVLLSATGLRVYTQYLAFTPDEKAKVMSVARACALATLLKVSMTEESLQKRIHATMRTIGDEALVADRSYDPFVSMIKKHLPNLAPYTRRVIPALVKRVTESPEFRDTSVGQYILKLTAFAEGSWIAAAIDFLDSPQVTTRILFIKPRLVDEIKRFFDIMTEIKNVADAASCEVGVYLTAHPALRSRLTSTEFKTLSHVALFWSSEFQTLGETLLQHKALQAISDAERVNMRKAFSEVLSGYANRSQTAVDTMLARLGITKSEAAELTIAEKICKKTQNLKDAMRALRELDNETI